MFTVATKLVLEVISYIRIISLFRNKDKLVILFYFIFMPNIVLIFSCCHGNKPCTFFISSSISPALESS